MKKDFRKIQLTILVMVSSILMTIAQTSDAVGELTSVDYARLSALKACYLEGKSGVVNRAVNKLLKNANTALRVGPFSVTNKTTTPLSGTKNDYLSLGPYWWPDPDKPDGLPWIRRDGEINPLTRGENVDEPRKNQFFRNTGILGMAYYFSEEQKYAEKANQLLRTWFVDPDKRMNPNLNFAQGIPGKNHGRGIGIIEFSGISNVLTTVEILHMMGALEPELKKEIDQWMVEYTNWLQTSEYGIFERDTKNNHATHYDKQLVSILLYLHREEEAREILETAKKRRIASQIAEDGKQPHELARTKAFSYSVMNLKAFTKMAWYGDRLGVDLWNYQPNGAGGLKDAYHFLYPYAFNDKEWDYEQISSLAKTKTEVRNLFLMAGGWFDVENYCETDNIKMNKLSLDQLLYICQNHIDCLN